VSGFDLFEPYIPCESLSSATYQLFITLGILVACEFDALDSQGHFLILQRSHLSGDPWDRRFWVMEDSCSNRYYLGFDPWFWNPVYARKPQVYSPNGRIDVANRTFEGGSLVVTAWRKQSPHWPVHDKCELATHTRTTYSSVR